MDGLEPAGVSPLWSCGHSPNSFPPPPFTRRIKAPHVHRPFRIPLPTWACVLLLLPACGLLGTMLVLPIIQLNTKASRNGVGIAAGCG